MIDLYAHTPAPGSDEWHSLKDHLEAVARMAQEFASAFGAGELAYWLGLWHDLGKCNPKFQEYLKLCYTEPHTKQRGPDHKAAGAQLARQYLGPLALLIQGHHGGLKNRNDFNTWFAGRQQDRATDTATRATDEAVQRARAIINGLEPHDRLSVPSFLKDPITAEFFLRMLFSTLVDADFLDTEGHRNPTKAGQRGSVISLRMLWDRFEHDQRQLSGHQDSIVGQARHAMYQACLAAAEQPPGLFRLAMPTGGGKTRSAMAFALRHALHNGQRRVIIAVPFISITEQTSAVYRKLFHAGGDEQTIVLEHHSGADTQRSEVDEYKSDVVWSRLAAENWDAPIIVTTTVQLFESLFANQTSRCRKLHRLANSVIILDEAQALPPHLLTPILDGLRQLSANFGTTVVISTATQPAFDTIRAFAELKAADIVPDATRWFAALKRVDYEWRVNHTLNWAEVADLLFAEPRALVVVNTKKDALALLDALADPHVLHLSTLLCGAHRRDVIAEVKRRLAYDMPCRLVSTQVIEAGVDLDFPLVLRAMGPLDSIVQAAGRCNREGRLERGRVIVFKPTEGSLPPGAYRTATDVTSTLLGAGMFDPDNPADASRYFKELFATLSLDRDHIQDVRKAWDFPEVARRFRMIDDETENVIVAYGDDTERRMVQQSIEHLRRKLPGARYELRRLQPYLVSMPKHSAHQCQRDGFIEPLLPGLGVWLGKYDSVRGIVAKDNRDLLVF